MSTMIQYVLYLAILVVLAIPLGAYIKNVMSGEKTFLSKVLTPCENLIYKVTRVATLIGCGFDAFGFTESNIIAVYI